MDYSLPRYLMAQLESALLPPLTPRSQSAMWPSALSGEICLLGALLCALQIADGVLTGIGVIKFGTSIEGNLLLRSLMESYGVIHTLLGVKLACIGIVLSLCCVAHSIPWLRTALRGVTSLYLFAAIIPWSCILLQHSL